MPPIKPRKFQVSRRQLNKRVNYFFRESPTEDVRPSDTISCVSQPEEPAGAFQNDVNASYCSCQVNCREGNSNVDDAGYRTGITKSPFNY
jgi:hypothetical protein